MCTMKLPHLEVVNATKKHTATLFFFHGSGSSGKDMKQWVDICNRDELKFPHMKIVYPTAPAQPYTPSYRMLSNVWFDRKDISIHVAEEVKSIDAMCHTISELIDAEVSQGIPYARIIIGGFSMGGALAFQLAYRFKLSVAGCFAISSFLNDNSVVYQHLNSHPDEVRPPLLQFHGEMDDLVPHQWGKTTMENLVNSGVKVQFETVPRIGHEIHSNEIRQLKQWILKLCPVDG